SRSVSFFFIIISYTCSFCSVVFLVLILRSPSSPVFPYTTLFRSTPARKRRRGRTAHRTRRSARGPCCLRRCRRRSRDKACCRSGDRKSTRLNSSHVKISYAVFCLKKKKRIR